MTYEDMIGCFRVNYMEDSDWHHGRTIERQGDEQGR